MEAFLLRPPTDDDTFYSQIAAVADLMLAELARGPSKPPAPPANIPAGHDMDGESL